MVKKSTNPKKLSMKFCFIHKYEKFFRIVIYFLAALFLCYEMALQVSPGVMTKALMKDFTIDSTTLGITAAFYFYSYTLMQIPAGLLYDKFGPRKLITLALIICSIGALFFSSTHHVAALALGRFLMGIGSAFAFIGVLIVAARWFHQRHFALLVGLAQLLAAIGAMGGALPLAKASLEFGWRDTIDFLAAFGFIIAIFTALIIRDYPKNHPRKHEDHYKLGLFKSLLETLKNSQIWAIAVYAFASWSPVAIFAALWGTPYLMQRYQITTTTAAGSISLIWVGLMITSPFIGWFSDKIKRRKILMAICSFFGFIAASILIFTPSLSFKLSYSLCLFLGIGASGQILSFALIKDIVKPVITATAVGFNNMAVVIGGALFQPLVGYLISKFWDGKIENGVPLYSTLAYTKALSIVPFCFLLALTACLFIKETYCKQSYPS